MTTWRIILGAAFALACVATLIRADWMSAIFWGVAVLAVVRHE